MTRKEALEFALCEVESEIENLTNRIENGQYLDSYIKRLESYRDDACDAKEIIQEMIEELK